MPSPSLLLQTRCWRGKGGNGHVTDCLGKLKRTSNALFLLKTGLGDAVRQEWNTDGVRE